MKVNDPYVFYVQASCPRTLALWREEDVDLPCAIDAVFPTETEELFVVWDRVCVRLNYRYDLGLMLDDLIPLCRELLSSRSGRRSINWPSSTFDVTWDMSWSDDELVVSADWRVVVGRVESLLARSIRVSKAQFLSEWKRPLDICRRALLQAGYTPGLVRAMEELCRLVDDIPGHGLLYGGEPSRLGLS